jgi:hypothetical protein
MSPDNEADRSKDEYEGQSVDLYLNEQIQELRVKVEVLSNVQYALRSTILSKVPELIPMVRESILGVAEITEPLWRNEKDRDLYRLEISKAVKLL